MSEFYTLSWSFHIFITLILGVCVLAQTVVLVFKFSRYMKNRTRFFENFLEISILFEILVLAILYGQMINGYKNGFLVPTGNESVRILNFLVILILAIIVSILKENLLILSVIPATLISLPIMENNLGTALPWFFIGALVFFLIRSIKICISNIIAIQTQVSALSIIHAVDTLHTGVLFSEKNGYTLLSNHQMQKLMISLTGKVFRNSIVFYDMLLSNQNSSRFKKTELDGEIVYLLADGSAWMFTKTEISFLMQSYIHISATDVTKLWTLTAKLQLQEQELNHKSNELKKAIANLHILSEKREIDKAKMRAHDILGQRLSVLLRIIENGSDLDHDLLTSLSKGLLAELKVENSEIGPYDELKRIQKVFQVIGVDINFQGKLPNNSEQAALFIDVIRESCTNAVRHALATQINIRAGAIGDKINLTINNNGHAPNTSITPGNGIKAMRKKVFAQGGNLNIIHYPLFTLSVVLPGGDQYV